MARSSWRLDRSSLLPGNRRFPVAAVTALGVAAVADVLYLNVRERAAELATLRATGWTERDLARLIALEGLYLGAAGALAGGAAGLAGSAAFASSLPPALLLTTLAAVLAGAALAGLAALLTATTLRRLPSVPLLAGD